MVSNEKDIENARLLKKAIRTAKLLRKQVGTVVYTNHIGKTKRMTRTNNHKNNHKRPARKYCGKKDSFTNPFGSFNISDEQFKAFINGKK